MRRLVVILAAALAWSLPAAAQRADAEILVHSGLAAGLRHHEAKQVWDALRIGDEVVLVREPGNPYDANAVRVDWNGHVLGYLPRTDNAHVARQLDRGSPLRARIARLGKYRNHRLKLDVDVYLPL